LKAVVVSKLMFTLLLLSMLKFTKYIYIPTIAEEEPFRVPGVNEGEFFKYGNFSAVWSGQGDPPFPIMRDFNNTEWIQVNVETVSGANVTFEFVWRFKNGTELVLQDWIDVNTGPNPLGVGYLFPFFISTNLHAGDALYNTTSGPYVKWKINETITREYLGKSINANHAEMSFTFPHIANNDFYWNQETGVLMEIATFSEYPEESGTFSLHFQIISTSINRYVYEMNLFDSSYFVEIKTDGIISGFSYTNFTFSLAWLSQGSYTNITLPKTLNNTSIKVMYHWMIQGWDESPQISANDTHYFVFGEGSLEGCIIWVCFAEPKIELDISTPTTYLGYYVNITGEVTYRDYPMSGIRVYIGWSSGGPLNEISTVSTLSDGTFTVSWMPHATGIFYIFSKLICPWLPDEVDVPVSYVCLSISLPVEQHIFSVVSNSTLSALVFDSTAKILSFSASGPNNTTGYAKVFISKQILTNINDLKVYVDGNQTEYTFASADNSWVINILYKHSLHEVRLVIPEFSLVIILPFFIVFSLTAIALVKRKVQF